MTRSAPFKSFSAAPPSKPSRAVASSPEKASQPPLSSKESLFRTSSRLPASSQTTPIISGSESHYATPRDALLLSLTEAFRKVIHSSVVPTKKESRTTHGLSSLGNALHKILNSSGASPTTPPILSPGTFSRPSKRGSHSSVPSWRSRVDVKLASAINARHLRQATMSNRGPPADLSRRGVKQVAKDSPSSAAASSDYIHPFDDDELLSMLSPLSEVIARTVDIDAEAAAELTDVVLEALMVNVSAVVSTIPLVAASARIADVIPLIIPAVAAALGKKLNPGGMVNSSDDQGTLHKILDQGIGIINQIIGNRDTAAKPTYQAILDQVAVVVYAAANRLNMALCATSQNVKGVPFEAVVPCAATGDEPPSVKVITLNPAQTEAGPTSAYGATTFNSSSLPLEISPSLPQSTASATLTSENSETALAMAPGAGSKGTGQYSSTRSPETMQDSSGLDANRQNCTSSCQSQEADQITSGRVAHKNITRSAFDRLDLTQNGAASIAGASNETPKPTKYAEAGQQPSYTNAECCGNGMGGERLEAGARPGNRRESARASSGPCPGRGFVCTDCLNGWFCPPQETPAQAVPCGLGWPCYHCNSGWFCVPGEEVALSNCPPAPMTATSSSPGSTQTEISGANSDRPDEDDALGWVYVGCFRDDINRTLTGSKPLDYLRGQMSNRTCIGHCNSRGYSFAGTESGTECWCGSSIRDDAVRLPESLCDSNCQGNESQSCGGSWAISVYLCEGSENSDQGEQAVEAAESGWMSLRPVLMDARPQRREGQKSANLAESAAEKVFDSVVELLAKG